MLTEAPHHVFHEALERICLDALRHEAMAWPKPGLVTPVDSGSHADMHIGTLIASIEALQGSFSTLAKAGAERKPYAELQRIGLKAEQDMLRSTRNINTHRGALFNLGLLVAGAALRRADSKLANLHCGAVAAATWGSEILASRQRSPDSHGDCVFQKFSAGGARAEAANGFPAIYQIGLPALHLHLAAGHRIETARIGALLVLMEHLEDTNLLWRGGQAGLEFVQSAAAVFNRSGGVGATGWQHRLLAMHRAFVARNLSPGGSADLMAASCAAHHIEATQ
jgi:triphosphoribosyl-dephospho-CoA synthase